MDDLVLTFRPLLTHSTLPVVAMSDGSAVSARKLRKLADANRQLINDQIWNAGVALVRGFEVNSAEEFGEVCAAIEPELRNYTGGDSPRTDLCDKVYTSTEYDADLEVLLHNELSYAGWCPNRVFFGCLKPSETGGETHIADGRTVYRSLNPEIRNRFEYSGICYLQHLWDAGGEPGIGKSWQETFETDSRDEAESYLRKSSMDFEWTELGIRTRATKRAVRVHEVTGEKCWHCQADQWHRDMPSVKDSVSGNGSAASKKDPTCGEDTLGNHVVFGDGSEIDIDDLHHIREVSRHCEAVFPWQQGDIMIIDNVLAMHGRKPFTGERSVVVAMA